MGRPEGKDRGLFERPKDSGTWWIRYSDALGQEHREKVGPKGLARKRYEQRKTEVRQNKFEPESIVRRAPWTVAKMMSHFREKRKVLGPKNQSEDQRYADLWAEVFGKYQLDQLKQAHLEDWRRQRSQEGVKPSTINRALTYLRAYFNLAIENGHCKENPVAKVKALSENNERARYLDEEDEYPKLKAAMGPEDFDLVEFALYTGLRQSEQFELEWSRVDLRASFLRIHDTKAGKERVVRLNGRAIEVLARQKQRYPGSEWVFPAPTKPSCPRDGHNFYVRVYKPACKAAGIKDLTWHDLRRSFGSWLIMKGAHSRAVQMLLGHSSSRMMERYAHLSPEYMGNAVDLLDKRSFGKDLKSFLRSANIDQKTFAEALGVTTLQVSSWLKKDEAPLDWATIRKKAQIVWPNSTGFPHEEDY